MISDSANLVVDFVNTYDVESDTDDLDRPETLSRWLAEHGLAHGAATATDLERARELREGLRTLLLANHDGRTTSIAGTSIAGMDALAARFPLQASFESGTPALVASGDRTSRGLGSVLAACVRCGADGTWSRLKACGEATCQWAFYDTTRNHSRSWCSMRVCGNRAKTRNYRSRQRTN